MTEPIILVKICYQLLYVIQGVKNIFTSWPQLISKLWLHLPACNAASDWPCTFYVQGVFV